ncbi:MULTISPECIES: hypothetical protein [Paenibacillus]|uniref:hypothetical protein n=1 Tax=Paenibacillus TaxID=44249 RepID=UPI0022B918E4|nr:hypothetical protein [Paenibacillus caseinilyticus]MCZ8520147.1 hypothetical protein [Paenibacillus caseinilyticus]
MDQAFDELNKLLVAGVFKIASSLLYLIVPEIIVIIACLIFGIRGQVFKALCMLGLMIGLYSFVYYGFPTLTK